MRKHNIFIKSTIVALLILCVFWLSSCGNKAVFDPGAFSFTHIHISDAVEGHCFDVKKWWDTESGIEVRFTSGEGAFCSEGTYQMFTSQAACPYCNED